MSTVLQIQDLSKTFGTRQLFSDASVTICIGQRVGLIGANGSGKTTLMRMILGQEKPEEGKIIIYPDMKLGYLEQNEEYPEGETVIDYLVRVSECESWECAKMAGKFDIKNEKLDAEFLSLSGGYQMRVRMAGILVQKPDLLLLDEPTNYLDLQTVLLLEEVLKSYRGSLLLVSHDREFLKNVCTHTLELEHEKFTLFAGDIEAYFAEKETRLEMQRRYNKKVQIQQRHLKDFVDRFRAKASKASQAQSKMKQLEKLKTIDIAHSTRTARIKLPSVPQRNAMALDCRDLCVGYAEGKPVLADINFEINRGDHIAVVGENGQGKSTLLKTLAGELQELNGSFKWGHNLNVAYYAQHVPQMMPASGTAGDYLKSVADRALPEELYKMAGNFLFSKDDLDKSITVLSGGEKARLCLAGICLGKFDVLILDEPTNHLDFDTVEALAEALDEYSGTVIFVSHSRTFVSQIANKILEIKDGSARYYPYSYEIYVYELKTHETFVPPGEDNRGVEGEVPFVRSKADVHADMQKEKRLQKKLEETSQKLTTEKERLLAWFIENTSKVDVEKTKRLKELDDEILDSESLWFSAQTRFDALEKEMSLISNGK
ncbi:MAG: ABC-F family ATP-binding cassette domain-containing protein [Patescibacteria group bacterium]|nr:ABC-F family ATP-binding cassette domain-containing protein [Patescibacteria group bacterium]